MNDWNRSTILVMAVLLFGLVGYHLAQQEKLNDRLKRMETFTSVCGDVANYFSPNTEMDEIAEQSKKRVVRK